MRSDALYCVLAVVLVGTGVVLFASHQGDMGSLGLDGPLLIAVGVGIGVVAAVMGVAGGELLIPTIVLLYGLDIKLASSLFLAVSLPTMAAPSAGTARTRASRSWPSIGGSFWPWPRDRSPARCWAACWSASCPKGR